MSTADNLKESTSDRFYTTAPRVGVGVVIVRETDVREVLLVRRAKEPSKGLWSVPGGGVELGETIAETARREVREETGLDVEVGPAFTAVDAILRDEEGAVAFHYVIVDVLAFVEPDASPVAADDVDAVQWVPANEVAAVRPITEKVPAVVELALELLDSGVVSREKDLP